MTLREASREMRKNEKKKRLFPLHPLPDCNAFLNSVRLNENVMHWQFWRCINKGEEDDTMIR